MYYEDTTITCEVMAQTTYKLQSYDLWPLSVSLTFDIESLVLYLTHLNIRLNTSNKYHEDATVICEFYKEIFCIWPTSVTFTLDIVMDSWDILGKLQRVAVCPWHTLLREVSPCSCFSCATCKRTPLDQ